MRAAIHRASWSRTMKQAAVSSMVHGGEKRRDVIATVCPGCASPLPPRVSRPARPWVLSRADCGADGIVIQQISECLFKAFVAAVIGTVMTKSDDQLGNSGRVVTNSR